MNVYILGAGASRHAGYPLASTMGAEMILWMSRREEYKYTADFIKEEFGDCPNIEDVITQLDGRIKSLKDSEQLEDRLERSNAAHQRGRLREVVPVWFTEIHTKPALAYQEFAAKNV